MVLLLLECYFRMVCLFANVPGALDIQVLHLLVQDLANFRVLMILVIANSNVQEWCYLRAHALLDNVSLGGRLR